MNKEDELLATLKAAKKADEEAVVNVETTANEQALAASAALAALETQKAALDALTAALGAYTAFLAEAYKGGAKPQEVKP